MLETFPTNCLMKEVVVFGLKSRPELNGERGIVKEHLLNGRLKVVLQESNIALSVSSENVFFEPVSKSSKKNEEPVSSTEETIPHAVNSNLKIWLNSSFFYPCEF